MERFKVSCGILWQCLLFISSIVWSCSHAGACTISATPSAGAAPLTITFIIEDAPLVQLSDAGLFMSGTGGFMLFPIDQPLVYEYFEAGTFYPEISLYYADGTDYECSGPGAISVLDADSIFIDAAAEPVTGYVPLSVHFSLHIVNGEAPFDVVMEFGDGSVETFSDVNGTLSSFHSYTASGEYSVSTMVTDSRGMVATSAGIVINVRASEDAPDDLAGIFEQGRQDILQVDDISLEEMSGKLENIAEEIEDFVEETASIPDNIREDVHATFLEEGTTFFRTASERLEQLLSGNFASFAADSDEVTLKDLKILADSAGSVLVPMIKNDMPFDSDFLSASKDFASKLTRHGFYEIGQRFGLSADQITSMLEDNATLRSFFAEHPDALKMAVSNAGLDMSVAHSVSDDVLEAQLSSRGLGNVSLQAMRNAMEPFVDLDKVLLQDGSNTEYVLGLLMSAMNINQSDISLQDVDGSFQLSLGANRRQAIGVSSLYVVPDILPEGEVVLPCGKRIVSGSGFAALLAPAAADSVAFTAMNNSGGNRSYRVGNGGWRAEDDVSGIVWYGAFGWDLVNEGGFSAGTVSFDVQNADPSSEAFSVLVRYSDGTVQSVPPSVAAMDALTDFLDTFLPGLYSIDTETGLLDLSAAGAGQWRPDYQFVPMDNFSDTELSWYDANKDSYGTAFQVLYLNSDDLYDIVFYSADPAGKQNLYCVSY